MPASRQGAACRLYLHHQRAGEVLERAGTAAERALCLNNLGVVAFFCGDLGTAPSSPLWALALRQECGDVRGHFESRADHLRRSLSAEATPPPSPRNQSSGFAADFTC